MTFGSATFFIRLVPSAITTFDTDSCLRRFSFGPASFAYRNSVHVTLCSSRSLAVDPEFAVVVIECCKAEPATC